MCRPSSDWESRPSVLKTAGAEDASIFLAVTDSDETNIVACLFANAIAPEATKLARIRTEEYTAYPKLLGSDSLRISMLINPEQEIVRSIELCSPSPVRWSTGSLRTASSAWWGCVSREGRSWTSPLPVSGIS
ncbi:MAG: NAD-binding protein [Bilophila sp.]